MSVRKAAGLEPSGLIAPRLGEVVSKAEVEAAKREPVKFKKVHRSPLTMDQFVNECVADGIYSTYTSLMMGAGASTSFGLGALSHQTVTGVDPATPGFDGNAFWIVNYGKPGSTPYVTIANDDQQPAPRQLPRKEQSGTFVVPDSELYEVERLATILDGVIVVSATWDQYTRATTYIGLHTDFADRDSCGPPRTYQAAISNGKRVWLLE